MAALLTVSGIAGHASPEVPVAFGAATLAGLVLMAIGDPPELDEMGILLAMAGPPVLLAASAWLVPDSARRRSVS